MLRIALIVALMTGTGSFFCEAARADFDFFPSITRFHSHNDYEQELPLFDALKNRITSVEADIWYSDGKILVSHAGLFFKGSLEELYLDPLQRAVEQRGSVYGDDRTFYLWLDIKERNPEMVAALYRLLDRYTALTEFTDSTVKTKPITIILTGTEKIKRLYTQLYPLRKACRDSLVYRSEDPPSDNRWSWYSLRWRNYFQWDGRGAMSQLESMRFSALVQAIHLKGRKVRFWDAPQSVPYWSSVLTSEADLIDTDYLDEVREFVSRPVRMLASPGLAP